MDSVLIVLTCASVAAAAAFGFSAWRSRTDETRRSAARVAALSAAIDGFEPAASAAPPPEGLASAVPLNQPVAVTSMFATASGAAVEGRPFVKLGVFAALAGTFLLVVAVASRDHPAQPAAASSSEATLELVSMHHTREGRALTVTGLVRNPRAGVPRANIDAVVLAFDRNGGFVASGRAGLDFTKLAPGDESPFVVKIPTAAGIVRYRVSFRTESGVVRHLDRRSAAAGGLVASADRGAGEARQAYVK